MRQLIARIDDRLHARLKARAKAQGRSVNTLVTDLLSKGLSADDERSRFFARLEAAGMRVIPPQPRHAPSLDEVVAMTRGLGRAASRALEEDRASG